MKDRFVPDDSFPYDSEYSGLGPLVPALATLVIVGMLLFALWRF
jgi:hypothetical protein